MGVPAGVGAGVGTRAGTGAAIAPGGFMMGGMAGTAPSAAAVREAWAAEGAEANSPSAMLSAIT
ncbi:MAG: hypothetical protein LBG81_02855 [Coriobacteriaceae bacterium]|nr:hypothetical protein [Coriobacteriaceae bacterium]